MAQLENPGRRHLKTGQPAPSSLPTLPRPRLPRLLRGLTRLPRLLRGLTPLPLLSVVCMALAFAGCTVQGTGDDDDDSSSTAGDPITLEIGPGEGIDLKTMEKLTGIKEYDEVLDVDRLVWPSDTPCKPYAGHGAPGEFPATCGDIWAGADDAQYDTFAEAWSALRDVDATDLGSGYYFWVVEGENDTHWGVVIGASDSLDTYVFWLDSVTAEGKIRYKYEKSH